MLQTLTPKMQSLGDEANQSIGKLLGPASGKQQQGNFSINLWRIAFHDAFKRLCPVRAGGHDCGCLPVLARMVCHLSFIIIISRLVVIALTFQNRSNIKYS